MMRRLIPLCLLLVTGSLAAADFTLLDRNTARSLFDPASYKQPTIVALWSSDCNYCRKNLELLSSLAKRNKRLRVITVAAEPENAQLGPILKRYALAGPHYAYGNDSPDAIAYAIDPNWGGELPRTFLFDGSGRQEKVSGVLSVDMLKKM